MRNTPAAGPPLQPPRCSTGEGTARPPTAFDIQAICTRDKYPVTIHATLTGATPQAVLDLLTDPHANHNTQSASGPAPKIMLPIWPGDWVVPPG